MEIRFEIQGIEPIPNTINSDVPMKKDDQIHYYNDVLHRDYIVTGTKYIVNDCEEQFYQLVSLQLEE